MKGKVRERAKKRSQELNRYREKPNSFDLMVTYL